MSKQKEHEVIKLYTKGLTPYEISKIFNCSASDIRIQLHKAGYSVYGRDNDTLILPEEIEHVRARTKIGDRIGEGKVIGCYKFFARIEDKNHQTHCVYWADVARNTGYADSSHSERGSRHDNSRRRKS